MGVVGSRMWVYEEEWGFVKKNRGYIEKNRGM